MHTTNRNDVPWPLQTRHFDTGRTRTTPDRMTFAVGAARDYWRFRWKSSLLDEVVVAVSAAEETVSSQESKRGRSSFPE